MGNVVWAVSREDHDALIGQISWDRVIAWSRRLRDLAWVVERINRAKGWHRDGGLDADTILARLMLITTEVAEAAEWVRDRRAWGEDGALNSTGREWLAEELVDVVIRVLHLGNECGLDLADAMAAKLRKNADRPFRHGKVA